MAGRDGWAARRLARLGARVTLIEKSARLGGALRFASLAYAANERLLDWLRREIEESSVEVRLGPRPALSCCANWGRCRGGGDRAIRGMPPIPGNDLPHVLSGDDLRAMMLGEEQR